MQDEKNEKLPKILNKKKPVYPQFLKAILIGSIASGSIPYANEEAYIKELPSELSEAIKSLQKKQGPLFVAKERYTAVGNKALRATYDGKDVLGRGALYTKLRIHKYCEDAAKVDELIEYMKNILDLPRRGLSVEVASAPASADPSQPGENGYYKWYSRQPVTSEDKFALIGRTTETKYDISPEELEEVIQK